jgi:hypothetical protein
MRPLDLQSERYQPTGGISAEGVSNQLGRPRIDRLTLLVREAVQNSWDARLSEEGPVHFGIAGFTASAEARRFLLNVVFRRPAEGIPLREELQNERLALLAIRDRGTTGLSGPTRADEAGPRGVAPNFVNLLRNVGHPPARVRGGGTYGFGKTALFLASSVRTIVVHTQTKDRRRIEQRFMAAALGPEFDRRSITQHHRHTGRHWWGRAGRGHIVEPLTGREAAAAAHAIGLPAFESGETGTTIGIISPDFEDYAAEDAMRLMSQVLLRYFWPKMVDGRRGRGTMDFEVSWEGRSIPLPRPEDVPPLGAFVQAFRNLQAQGTRRERNDAFTRSIECLRPREYLGAASLVYFPASPRLGSAVELGDATGPFSSSSHHVALLRGPRFVVRYVEGPAVPFDQFEYAGVFIASEAAEDAFAKSEPPTHDDWVPDILEDRRQRTLVRVALRNIRDALEEFSGAHAAVDSEPEGVPLGAFSDMLGGLAPAIGGRGAGAPALASPYARATQASSSRGGSARSALPLQIALGQERLEMQNGIGALVVPFEIQRLGRSGPRTATVVAKARVVLDDGTAETDPPDGADIPRVLGWRDGSGSLVETSDRAVIPADARGTWTVAVSVPRDAAVGVELVLADETDG